MALDPYMPCPGGLDKKIKFCCPDLMGELETVFKMFSGEQYLACLSHLEKLNAKFPDRACLLMQQALTEINLQKEDDARRTVEKLLAKHPDNPAALALQSALYQPPYDIQGRSALVLKALAAIGNKDELNLYLETALSDLVQAAAEAGSVLQALGFARLLFTRGSDKQRAGTHYLELNRSEIPTVVKVFFESPEPPQAGASWKEPLEEALELMFAGKWNEAAEKLQALAEKNPQASEIWKNLAMVQGWLGEDAAVVATLKKLAAVPQLSADDAVEAEAIAQWLSNPETTEPFTDMVVTDYPITDWDKLLALLGNHPQVVSFAPPHGVLEGEGEPPPRNAYFFFDKAEVKDSSEVKVEQFPQLVGQVFLFGKQTDREARLVTLAARHEQLPQVRQMLAAIVDGTISAAGEEKILFRRPLISLLVESSTRFPEALSIDRREELSREHQTHALLQRWADLPSPLFGDKTARRASADPNNQRALLGAILLLEQQFPVIKPEGWNQLRASLNLPLPAPIPASEMETKLIPAHRLLRLPLAELPEARLIGLLNEALFYHCVPVAAAIARQIIDRGERKVEERLQLYPLVIEAAENTKEMLACINRARDLAVASNFSSGPWDLEELRVRFTRRESDDIGRLINHLQTEHAKEQNIMQGLVRLLMQLGIITPDGRMKGMPPGAEMGARPGSGAVPAPAEPAAGKLWTPGQPTEPTTEKKSAIWTPGMD